MTISTKRAFLATENFRQNEIVLTVAKSDRRGDFVHAVKRFVLWLNRA